MLVAAMLLVAACSAGKAAPATAPAAPSQTVLTADERRISGAVTSYRGLVTVRDAKKHTYLSSAIVVRPGAGKSSTTAPAAPSAEEASRARAEMAEFLRANGAELADLTGRESLRLRAILRAGGRQAPAAASRLCDALRCQWAEPLAHAGAASPQRLDEACRLAALVARQFADPNASPGWTAAADLARSSLPMELKLSIFRYACALPGAERADQWRRSDFTRPRTGGKYFYYAAVPPGYTPRRAWPALIALHGQTASAESQGGIWGAAAMRAGMVLISPEYIYGRQFGYTYGQDERWSVVGALRHAARRFHIDMDRVYLTGYSQGGHACWDIGMGQSGCFAGVLPMIGVGRARQCHANLRNTALYCVDGSENGEAPKFNRESIAALAAMGADATYVEYVGRGHDVFFEEFPAMLAWMGRHVRDPAAGEARLVAVRDFDTQGAWLRIVETSVKLPSRLQFPSPQASVEARADRNVIRVSSRNVRRLEVLLPAGLIDFAKPLTVYAGPRRVFHGRITPDWTLAFREAAAAADRMVVYLGKIDVAAR